MQLPNGATIPNRFAKSATSEALAHRVSGKPGKALATLYERWGRGGTGLLITGNVVVDPGGRTEPGNVIVYDDRHLEELTAWASAAQRHGARLWMQINHAGRQTPRKINRQPVAPSAVGLKGFGGLFARPRALEDDEINELIHRYATAAGVAQRAGFHGVQIHGAHGYLVSQFLSSRTNLRTDKWGGSAENRMRFLVEIVRAMRAVVGEKFPIGVKLNSADFQRGGFSEEESMNVVRALEHEGIDLLEISGGSYEQSAMMGDDGSKRDSTKQREAYFLAYAEKVRYVTGVPLLLTGGMRTAATMNKVIAENKVDMVGLARPLIVEPDLPSRVLSGTAKGATSSAPRSRVKMLDDMLQISWYQAQLRRMAVGKDPNPNLGKWGPLTIGFVNNYAFNPLTVFVPQRKIKRRLAATVSS